MHVEGKIFCWDLDSTLGYFTGILSERIGTSVKGTYPNFLKYGIKQYLAELRESGNINLITTSANADYVTEVLKRTGLGKYFNHIVTDCSRGNGKQYRKDAEIIGLSDVEIPNKMVAIGDSSVDRPIDLPIVFIHHPLCYKYDTLVLRRIVEKLHDLDASSFKRGFSLLYSSLTPENLRPDGTKYFDFEEGIRLKLNQNNKLQQVNSTGVTSTIPTILVIPPQSMIKLVEV